MFSVLSALAPRSASTPAAASDPVVPLEPSRDLDLLLASLAEVDLTCPWSPQPDAVELALLDAVFAIRTTYGSPTTGVRAWVAAYAEAVGDQSGGCDDLSRLADSGERLAELAEAGRLTRQRVFTGALKIEAITAAASALHGLPGSPRTAAELRRLVPEGYVEARDAFASVEGLGVETFEYLLLLLGSPGRRAMAAWTRFATTALDRHLDRDLEPAETDVLLVAAADASGLEPAQLAHAVWRHGKRG